MNESTERKRFEELQKLTGSEEFKARVAYLEDKQKWEKTEDSKKEKRFAELQKLPQLINYLKYKNSNIFDFFKKWNLVFEDRFESGKLDPQKWMTQSHWASVALGRNFSQVGDLHAFTEGKNISVDGKLLKLEVRKEKAKGMQWQIPFGFIEKEFDYTSGIVSTAGGEWWKHGILEAKVKYAPAQHLVDAIYLLGEESSPQINLVEMGVKNRMGLFTRTANGIQAESESLSGLKPGEFYIFRLEWSPNSLVWKINNREIFSVNNNVPAFKMHLNAASVVVDEPTDHLPHRFEIDWVRFYQQAKA
jgi:beta-glucanase (GH16 family)